MLNRGKHYKHGIEAIQVINSHNLNFNLGNCIKYVLRAPYKGTHELDLIKAIDYLNFELVRLQNEGK